MTCTDGLPAGVSSRSLQLLAAAVSPFPPPAINRQSLCYCVVLRAVAALSLPAASTAATGDKCLFHARDAAVQRFPLAAARHTAATGAAARTEAANAEAAAAKSGAAKAAAAAKLGAAKAEAAAATEAREVAAAVRSASVSSPAPVAHGCSRLAARQFHSRAARPAAAAVVGARRGQTHLLSSSCGAAASPCLSAAPDSAASLSAAAALAAPRVFSAASSISPRDAAVPALPQLRAAAAPAKPLRAAAAARARAAAAGATSTAAVVAGTPAAAASPGQLLSLPEFLLRRKRRFPPAQQQQAAFDLAVIFESLSALSCSANVAAISLASRAAAVASTPRAAVLVPRESGGAAAPTPSLPAVSPAGAAAAACTADPLVGFSQRQQSKAAPPHSAAAVVGGLHACGKTVRGEEEAAATARRLWSAAVETAKANSDVLQVPQLLGIVHAAARANIKVPSFATKMRQRALQLVKQICSPHAFLRLLLDLEKMDGLNDRQLLLFRDAIAARLLPARAGKGKMTETPLQGEKQQLHAGEEEDTPLHKERPQERQTHAAERREVRKGSERGGGDEEGAGGGGGTTRVKGGEAGMPAGEREEKLRVERVREAPMDARERTAVEKGEHEGRTNAENCGEEASEVWDTGKNGGRAGMSTVESSKPVHAGDGEVLLRGKREGRELLLLQTPEEKKSEPVPPPGAEEEASQTAEESRVAALLHAEERRWEASVVRPAPPFVVVMLLHLLAKHRIRDVDILLQASSSLLHEEVALLAALRQTPALLPTLVLSLAKLEAGGCCKLLLQELLDRHAFPLLSELRVQELLNLAYALVCLHTHSRVTILRSGSANQQHQQKRCSRQQDRCSRQHEWQEQEGQFDQQQQQQHPPCPQQQLREGQPCIQQQPEKQLWVQRQTRPDEHHEQQVQGGEQVQQPPQEACAQQQQRCYCSRSRSRGRGAGSTARGKSATSSEVMEPLSVDKQRLQQQEQVRKTAAFKVQRMSDVHLRRNLVYAEGTAKLSRIATAFDCGSLSSTSNKPTSETVNRCSVPVVEKKWGAVSSSALPAAANGGGVVAGAAVAAAEDSAAAASIGGACLRSTTSGSACASGFYTRATAARADSFGSAGHDIATPSAGSTANAVGDSGGAADFSTAAAAASAPADTASEASLSVGQSGAIARAAAAACPAPLSNQENGFACSPEQLQQRSLLLTTTLRLLLHRLRRDREARPTAASSIAWRQLKFVDAYLAHDVGPLRLAEHQRQQQEECEPQQTPPQELHKLQARLQGKLLERSGRGRTVHGEIVSLLLHARQRAVSNVVRISELQKRVGSMLLQQQIEGLVVEQPVGPFVLDFAIPSKRVAVEIDGEAHFYLHTSVPTARTRFKRELLTAMGWHVVVVPEELWKQKKKTKVKNFVTKKVREALAIT